jgi:hypothetical protein
MQRERRSLATYVLCCVVLCWCCVELLRSVSKPVCCCCTSRHQQMSVGVRSDAKGAQVIWYGLEPGTKDNAKPTVDPYASRSLFCCVSFTPHNSCLIGRSACLQPHLGSHSQGRDLHRCTLRAGRRQTRRVVLHLLRALQSGRSTQTRAVQPPVPQTLFAAVV